MRPLLYLRKRNLLGPMFGRYAGVGPQHLIKSAFVGGSPLPAAVFSVDLAAAIEPEIGELRNYTRSGGGASTLENDGMVPATLSNAARFVGANTAHNVMPGLSPQDWSNPPANMVFSHGIDADGEYVQATATALTTFNAYEDLNILLSPLNNNIRVTNRVKFKLSVNNTVRVFDGNTGSSWHEFSATANQIYDICPGEEITVATGGACGLQTAGVMFGGHYIRFYHVSSELACSLGDTTAPANVNTRNGSGPELVNQHWDGVNVNNSNSTGEITFTGGKWQFSNVDTGNGGYLSVDKSILPFESITTNRLAITRISIDVTVSNITLGNLNIVVWHGFVGNGPSQDISALGVGKHLLTFVHPVDNTSPLSAAEDFFWIQINNSMLAGDSFTFTIDEVTHKLIDYGAFADSVDPETRLNGNSVNGSQEVVVLTGASILSDNLLGYLSAPSHTNDHNNSENRQGSIWSGTNVTAESRTVLRDTPIGVRGGVRYTLNISTTVYGARPRLLSGGNAPQTPSGIASLSIFARTSERYLGLTDYNDRANRHITFDTQNNMAITAQGISVILGGAVDLGNGWYWLYVTWVNTAQTSCNLHASCSTQPDAANTFWNSTGSEWIECMGYMFQDSATRPGFYVPADGASATKPADLLLYNMTDVFPTTINEFSMSCEFYSLTNPNFGGTDRSILQIYNAALTRGFKIGHNASGQVFAEKYDGTTVRLVGPALQPRTRYKIMYGFSNIVGEYLVVNGATASTTVDTTAVVSSPGLISLAVGANQSGVTQTDACIKNVRLYDEYIDEETAKSETA